jgi:hypothetical protein
LLDQVSDVDKLKEGNQRCYAVGGVRYLPGVVLAEMVYGSVESVFDMAGTKDLKEGYKDSFALLPSVGC